MIQKLKTLFELQTNILLNYVLTSLLKFFLNNKQAEHHLYDTIIPIRSLTRTELRKAGKTIPNTFKYELWIKSSNNRILFILRSPNYSEIEIHNLLFTQFPPNISTLKNMAKFLVANYRPIPTKIDKEFSKLAKTYSDYLEHYDLKRQWNNGYAKKYKSKKTRPHLSEAAKPILYREFSNDLTRLVFEYKVLSKIMIDIYRNRSEMHYINNDHTYELTISYAKSHGISLNLFCLFENFNCHEIISLNKFDRNNKFFKKNKTEYNAILSCIAPLIS